MAGLLAARVLVDHVQQVVLVRARPLPGRGWLSGRRAAIAPPAPCCWRAGRASWNTSCRAWRGSWPTLARSLSAGRATCSDSGRRPGAALRARPVHVLRPPLAAGAGRAPPGAGLTPATRAPGARGHRPHPERGWRGSGRPSAGRAGQDLTARLVVDASRRRGRPWSIRSLLGARQYALPDGFRADRQALCLQPRAPSSTRGGGSFPIEGGRWLVTAAGVGRDYPPIDDAGFLDFARSLRSPILYEAIREARPLTPVVAYRRHDPGGGVGRAVDDWARPASAGAYLSAPAAPVGPHALAAGHG